MRDLGSRYDQAKHREKLIDVLDAIDDERVGEKNCPVCGFPLGTKKIKVHADGEVTHARERCSKNYRAVLV